MTEHIIITLPAIIKWEDYQIELDAVSDGNTIMNFKVPFLPKRTTVNESRVYLCHRGSVVGYMTLTGMSTKEFTCQTTGRKWSGSFVERTGKFHSLKNPYPMKGFQGWRYVDPEKVDLTKLDL